MLDELSFQRYTRIRDRLVLLPWAVLENLAYRQLTTYWRLHGSSGSPAAAPTGAS